MKVDRKELLDLIKALEPGLSSTEMIEQSSCLVFTGGEIISYNDEVSVSTVCPYDGFEFVVNGKSLITLLTKLKDKELDFELKKSELIIKGKNTKASLVTQAEILVPLEAIKIPNKWRRIPVGFLEGVQLCSFCAGKDSNKPIMKTIHIDKDYVEASDSLRATRAFLENNTTMKDLLIPANSVSNLAKYEPTQYAVVEGWIHFRNKEAVIYSCRVFEGEYPKTGKLYELEGDEIVLPDNLDVALDIASIFSNEDDSNFVEIKLSKNKMVVKSQNVSGKFERAIRIKNKEEVSFTVNLNFFLQSVKKFEKMIVGERTIVLTGDGFEHVMALILD